MEILIRINAFRFTQTSKHQLLWEMHLKYAPKSINHHTLFEPQERKTIDLPHLESSNLDDIHDEIEILGFPLCNPFSIVKDPPSSNLTTQNLSLYINKHITIYGYLVTVKHTKTSRGQFMYFGTFIDLDGQWLDTVHFPKAREMNCI